MILADTSFIIDVMKGEKAAYKKLEELKRGGISLLVSTITMYELYAGVSQAVKMKNEKKKVETALSKMRIVEFDERSAVESGQVHGYLHTTGQMIDIPDIMIAGTARACDYEILTRNHEHFKRVPRVRVECY